MKPKHVATLNLDLGTAHSAPAEFLIFKAGVNSTTKGDFNFDGPAAQSVMARYQLLAHDMMIDYNHQATDGGPSTDAGKAAGWFGLEIRGGELWAVNVKWTPPAAESLANREWRYTSPTFTYNPETGSIEELWNVAITNLPATIGQSPLMAAGQKGALNPNTERTVNMIDEIKRALACDDASALATLNRAASVDKIVAETLGTRDPNAVREAIASLAAKASKTESLAAELKALKNEVEGDRHSATLSQAIVDGKIPPAERDYWAGQPLASLTSYVQVATKKVSTGRLDLHPPSLSEPVDPRLLAHAKLSQDDYVAAQIRLEKKGVLLTMAALTKENPITRYGSELNDSPLALGVAANTVIYQGALVVLVGGFASNAVVGVNLPVLGVAKSTYDNRTGANRIYPGLAAGDGTAGNIIGEFLKGTFVFANNPGELIVAADIESLAWILDNQTVAKTNGGSTRSAAGKIRAVTPDGVAVLIG